MRLPWLQVDQDAFERAVELAAVLGIEEARAMGHLVFLWRWSLSRPADLELSGIVQGQTAVAQVEAGARWRGTRGEFVEALIELGLITEDGAQVLRVKGLDRYREQLSKRAQDRERKEAARLLGRPEDVRRTSIGQTTDETRQTQTQTQTQKKEQLPLSTQAAPEVDPRPERVFEHWRRVMGKRSTTVFDAKRRKAVEGRLRDGYSVEELCQAVDGCTLTPHNMGQNDRGERYDDLELICRDASRVDRFRARAGQAGASAGPSRDDQEALDAACRVAAPMNAQLPSLLAECRWERWGELLVGRTTDPFRVEWWAANWPELRVMGVRVELEPGVEQREAAA